MMPIASSSIAAGIISLARRPVPQLQTGSISGFLDEECISTRKDRHVCTYLVNGQRQDSSVGGRKHVERMDGWTE